MTTQDVEQLLVDAHAAQDRPTATPECLGPATIHRFLNEPESTTGSDRSHFRTCPHCQWQVSTVARHKHILDEPLDIDGSGKSTKRNRPWLTWAFAAAAVLAFILLVLNEANRQMIVEANEAFAKENSRLSKTLVIAERGLLDHQKRAKEVREEVRKEFQIVRERLKESEGQLELTKISMTELEKDVRYVEAAVKEMVLTLESRVASLEDRVRAVYAIGKLGPPAKEAITALKTARETETDPKFRMMVDRAIMNIEAPKKHKT